MNKKYLIHGISLSDDTIDGKKSLDIAISNIEMTDDDVLCDTEIYLTDNETGMTQGSEFSEVSLTGASGGASVKTANVTFVNDTNVNISISPMVYIETEDEDEPYMVYDVEIAANDSVTFPYIIIPVGGSSYASTNIYGTTMGDIVLTGSEIFISGDGTVIIEGLND